MERALERLVLVWLGALLLALVVARAAPLNALELVPAVLPGTVTVQHTAEVFFPSH